MSKNVAVFVDVANIFYAAKAAGVDIDYVTLLKSASAGRDLVRAYAYTGLDPDNENQRNFHSFLARHGYKVVSKDIRKYGDGKVKANLDIELVVDMMKTSRNLDIAIVVSGDGDFAPAIRAVQEMGVRVEVISFRGNTSSDLIDVADVFTDIVNLARVEKASSRSGRRVAGDDEDLSMTEVPDKQTEGTGGRGRGRTRGRGRDAEPSRAGRRAPVQEPAVAGTPTGAPLVVLPGEKLSKVAPAASLPRAADIDDADLELEADEAFAAANGTGPTAADAGALRDGENGDGRRRRRRGGRGRGRGRGRTESAESPLAPVSAVPPTEVEDGEDEEEEQEIVEAPRRPRTTPFGSVWDSQLGVSTAGSTPLAPLPDDDEDLEEPEIPEYLIAERKNRSRPQPGVAGRGARGGNRAAYAAAIDRERYGRGPSAGGINRYPDVSGRERPSREPAFGRRDRNDRGDRPERNDHPPRQDRPERAPRGPGGEPWSEVPPELEAMLRAQLSNRPSRSDAPAAPRQTAPRQAAQAVEAETTASAPSPGPDEAAAPKRRTTRRTAAAKPVAEATVADASVGAATPVEAEAPKPRARRTATAATAEAATDAPAPKRRTTRAKASGDAAPEASPDAGVAEAPKRRTTRRKVSGDTPAD
ncbi:MAG TPA: NYN domain-containing protein [Candidatus Limnocylindrales bacterium]|nr:NYN domain-containing protein [Candidatus Limnocylindrales bacterium]